jgi:hypothetical protein
MSGPKRGLSTFEVITDIPPSYRPAQRIETDDLGADLEAVRNGGGKNSHVSIVPTNDLALQAPTASKKQQRVTARNSRRGPRAALGIHSCRDERPEGGSEVSATGYELPPKLAS